MTHVANGSNGLNYAVPKCYASTFIKATPQNVAGSASEGVRAEGHGGRVTGENHGENYAAGLARAVKLAHTFLDSTTNESDSSSDDSDSSSDEFDSSSDDSDSLSDKPNAAGLTNVAQPTTTGPIETTSEVNDWKEGSRPFLKAQW